VASRTTTTVRRHRNQGGYGGRQIPIGEILDRVVRTAKSTGWTVEEIVRQAGYPVWVLVKEPATPVRHPRRIYISAGIHGDEPASTLAALHWLEQKEWPSNAEIVLFPCLNPAGMAQNQREGPEGIDFNRDYRAPKTALVKAHREWLRGCMDFDVALLLHEDWEADGFYLYELSVPTARSAAEDILSWVSNICPILNAGHADGWPVTNGVVRPSIDRARRDGFPEALYLFLERVDLCYTLEAPSDYDLSVRVAALVSAVRTIVGHACVVERPASQTGECS
jgi:hypothetical protein